MSYNGTVRCGYCYQRGHNKRSCPKLKAFIECNPNSYAASCASTIANTKRVCSYCKKTDHNKRTCNELRTNRAEKAKDNRKWRQKFLALAKDIGFAPGALIQIVMPDAQAGRRHARTTPNQLAAAAVLHDNWIERNGSLAMVRSFNPKYLNADCADGSTAYRPHVYVTLSSGRTHGIQLPIEFESANLLKLNKGTTRWRIVCPSNKDLYDCFSASFHDGTLHVDTQLGL